MKKVKKRRYRLVTVSQENLEKELLDSDAVNYVKKENIKVLKTSTKFRIPKNTLLSAEASFQACKRAGLIKSSCG